MRHGLVTVGLLVAIAGVIAGLYWHSQTPDPDAYRHELVAVTETQLDRLSPQQLWVYWNQHVRSLAETGLVDENTRGFQAFRQYRQRTTGYRRVAFAAAGLAAIFCVAVCLWPRRREPRSF